MVHHGMTSRHCENPFRKLGAKAGDPDSIGERLRVNETRDTVWKLRLLQGFDKKKEETGRLPLDWMTTGMNGEI